MTTITRGINVRNAGENRYADFLVDGVKMLETRNANSLRPYIGKTVGIIRTGEGPATLIGSVLIGRPFIVSAVEFRVLQYMHLVPAGSKFDIAEGKTKYLYPITQARRFATPRAVLTRGIIARAI